MNESLEIPAPQRRIRRFQSFRKIAKWLTIKLLTLSIVVFLVRAYYVHDSEQRLAETESDADRLDPGWRWDEQLARRAVVADEKNSAHKVFAAAQQLPKGWPEKPFDARDDEQARRALSGKSPTVVDQVEALDPLQPLDEALLIELRENLKGLNGALAATSGLSTLTEGRYPVNWKQDLLATLLPHSQDARAVAGMLRVSATIQTHEGDLAGALTSCRAALNVGRSLGDDPMLISLLVRIVCTQHAVGGVERALAHGQASDSELANVQDLFQMEAREGETILLTRVRGERAAWHRYADVVQSGDGLEDHSMLDLRSNPFFFWLYISINLRYGQALAVELLTEACEIAKQPLSQQRERWHEWQDRVEEMGREKKPHQAYAVLLMPALVKIYSAHGKGQALLRCAITAIAAERYRLASGHWPETLEALLPMYLPEIPLDPFVQNALRYRRVDDGVIIYSVGPDGEDNDGNLHRRKLDQPAGPLWGTDIGFRLWDPDKRRQPPVPRKGAE
jgi:muramidase (phage lysozyme)